MMEGEPIAPLGVVSERQVRCALDVTAATWLIEAKDLEGARRVLESAITLVPHDVPARSILAMVLFRLRDFIAASELYERLLSEFRGDSALTFNLALCHLKSGRADAAAAGFRSVLAARPDHVRARTWLGVAEAAVEAASVPPVAAPVRASVRPSRLDDLPRVTLAPNAAVAKDATGVVSVRVRSGTRWLARPDALQGYAGDVTLEARAADGDGVVSLSGSGTAFLRAKDELVVIDLRGEATCVRASSLIAYASTLVSEPADPDVVGQFGEDIVRFSGIGTIVMEAHAELVALPVSLTHATTVRWDTVVGWTGNVIGAPSDAVGPDGHALARFAGNGSLLLAMHDRTEPAPVVDDKEWYGRYEVLRRLDGTPREEVLLARSHGPAGFQRKVILKRHRSRCDGDSQSLQLFAREAHAYALLTHPGIVRLYDFLLLDGHPVLVLEYVSGISVAAMRAALREEGRAIGDELAFYIGYGVFSALAAAHNARDPESGEFAPVIHRGVRPGNVLVGWNGDVKLANFATPKPNGSREGAPSDAPPEHTGNLAPEQLRGEPITVGTDVYLAALLLHEMLTEGRTFDSLPHDQQSGSPRLADQQSGSPRLADQQSGSPRLADHAPGSVEATGPHLADLDLVRADLSAALRNALRIALAPDPGARTVSAAELAQLLEQAFDFRAARTRCVEELTSLRESAFEHVPKSSAPPPPSEQDEDSGFFRALRLPKPSPVPRIELDPFPVPVGGFAAAPDVVGISEAHEPAAVEEEPAMEDVPVPASGDIQGVALFADVSGVRSRADVQELPPLADVPVVPPLGEFRGSGRSLAAVALHPSEPPPDSRPSTVDTWRPRAPRDGIGRRRSAAVALGIAAVMIGAAIGAWAPRPPSSGGRAAATESFESVDKSVHVALAAVAASPPPELAAIASPAVAATAPLPADDLGTVPTPAAPARTPASEPAIPQDGGMLHTPPRAAQHRIFVDGRVIGEGEGDYPVPCGTHTIRVGSRGDDVSVAIPCGGLVSIE